ncbi:hypothetical protein [Kineosporia sp. NBRC 101731]|uniref:hypothetical protein n=1 Tax=Kineosporia sp. NBRC 101731 TaxID=3032199 RepID=UPI0024A0453C|nr:hypothetical protein [Kineosporia sp. NBRC 101731]GLY28954.1 hypothetical protein Kisp02_23190 [Kineosporia sp. NBRC 101731]
MDDELTGATAEPAQKKKVARWRRAVRRGLWILAALLTLVALTAGAGVGTLVVRGSGSPDRSIRSSGQDAYWLGHAWVDGRKTQADVDALATQLTGTGMRDLFVHAGPYADDGTLDPALRPRAAWLVKALHTALPEVRVQAWLGNVLADDRMDMSSASTRARVLTGVDGILADGFDGVHYDFEPSANDDQNFVDLLAATRIKTQAHQALLSVATPRVELLPGLGLATGLSPVYLQWTPDYMRQVAGHVDQIAIMAYDSGLPSERAYTGYVRRQTEVALTAVPDDVTLLIGAPAYHDKKINRYDGAETISASITGVQLALAGTSRRIGLALYVDFDATHADWAAYEQGWSRKA